MPKRTPPPIRLDQEVNRVLVRLGSVAVLALLIAMVTNVWRTATYAEADAAISAGQALAQTDAGMIDEESALGASVSTHQPLFLKAALAARQRVVTGDALAQQYVVSNSTLLTGFVAVRLAQDNWQTKWAAPILASQPIASPDVSFLNEAALFASYRSAEEQLSTALVAHVNGAEQAARVRAWIGFAAEGGLLAVAILLWWRGQRRLRRYVLGPVSSILGVVKRIGGGDYNPPAPLGRGPIELRAVSEQLASVAITLEAARTSARERAEEAAEHAARLRRIVEMGREIAGSLNLHYVLEAVSNSVLRVGTFPRCVMWLTAEGGATLFPVLDSAGADGRVEGLGPIRLSEQTVGEAARLSRVVGPQAVSHPDAPQPWSRAIAVPMIVGTRVIGVIEIGLDDLEETAPAVMDLVQTISSQAATAIEAARLYEQAEKLGMTDALTLLPNRRDLQRALGDEVTRAQRYDRPLAVAMLDIDHFKTVNDTEGHSRGDEVLQEIATVMRSMLRSVDTIYRYGGEEFLVVMPETDAPTALDLCNRVRAAVAARVAVAGRMITISGGVASFPGGGRDPARLIASADEAMYRAKRGGRNQVVAAVDSTVAVVRPAPLPLPA